MNLVTIFEKNIPEIPCWFMRQAGRYLPEYQALRKDCPDFIQFCFTPSLVKEATFQPLKRYDLDAAIIFSDILVLPQALGQSVVFEKNFGPRLAPYTESLQWGETEKPLEPVYESIKMVREHLSPNQALIGFAGAPYTLACYMLEGKSSPGFSQARLYGFRHPEAMESLLKRLTEEVIHHLRKQAEAGCNVLQLFESWAGNVPDGYGEPWLVRPARQIVKALKTTHPHVPLLIFPKGLGTWIPEYIKQTHLQGISLGSSEHISHLLPHIPEEVVIQGTLDPHLLVAGGQAMLQEVDRLVGLFKERRYIFNLGHGIVPETPPEHVDILVNYLKTCSKKEPKPYPPRVSYSA